MGVGDRPGGRGGGGCRIGFLLFPLPLPWRFFAAGMPDGSRLGRRTAIWRPSPGPPHRAGAVRFPPGL